MREGMVRRRGLMSGGERLLVDLPETPTAGRTLASSPRTRCSGKSEPHERTTGGGANHEDSTKGLDLWF